MDKVLASSDMGSTANFAALDELFKFSIRLPLVINKNGTWRKPIF